MPEITLHPSLPLTPFAKDHLQELKFGPHAPLIPPSTAFKQRDLNWFGRCVQKIDQCNSNIVKIARTVVLALLTITVIGIPLVAMHNAEVELQSEEKAAKSKIIATLNKQNATINKRAQVVEVLGLETFKNAPQLDLKDKMGQSGYIDFLEPKDLSSSIMKGQDKHGRAFISLKLQRIANSQAQPETFVFTIFERVATNYPFWCHGSRQGVTHPKVSNLIEQKDLELLRHIIDGKDLEFKLAS